MKKGMTLIVLLVVLGCAPLPAAPAVPTQAAEIGSPSQPTQSPTSTRTSSPDSRPLPTDATIAATTVGTASSVPTEASSATITGSPTYTPTPRPPTLRELADIRGFKIGTFYMSQEFDRITAIQEREFNLAGIYVGMSLTQPEQGTFDFDIMRGLANRAERNKREIIVHPLIWAGDIPRWLSDRHFSREELITIIRNHISMTMRQLIGKKAIYVVVNEAYINDDIFNAVIGSDYVDIAFQVARATDPSAILIYNDYNNHTTRGERTKLTRQIVERLKSKKLIDGVGLEMHLNGAIPPTNADVITTMKSYGMPVYVTEFDVNLKDVTGSREQRFAKQARLYKEMFRAAIESGVCRYFVVFQTGDKFSVWETLPGLPGYSVDADPTAFDDNLSPKPAYFALRDALMEP